MKLNSLAFRLFATSAAWTLLVLPLAGFLIYRLYREDVQATFDARLEKLVNAIAVDSMGGDPLRPVTPTNRYEPLFESIHSGWYWQIEPVDDPALPRLVSASLASAAIKLPVKSNLPTDANGARWMNAEGPSEEPIRLVEVIDTLEHTRDAPRYSIIVAGPIDWLESRVENFLTRLTVALALTGAGLVSVTIFQVRFGLLPLRQIEQSLSDVRSGRATMLQGELPAEIKPLQLELNALLSANQDIIDRARTQVGNLAHALKTPLAVITNEAREEKTPLGRKIVEQANIMRDQVNHYLDRARVAARVDVIGRSTPVREVIEPLVRALERIHRDREVVIDFECPSSIQFAGERQDLEEILGNLCDNACKWAHRTVTLKATVVPTPERTAGPRLIITIDDDGPGLTEEQRTKIGKRGVRLDESKPGSGLGLSIVTDLVQSYRGQMELTQSSYGGLCVRLHLPSPQPNNRKFLA